MNERLKALIARNGMDAEKVRALLAMFDDDELWVEKLLLNANTAQKAAMAAGVSYKAAADGIDIPVEVDDALLALYEQLGNDWAAVVSRLSAPVAAEQKRSDPARQHTPAIGALVQQKAAPAWSFAAAMQGSLETDMVPR